MKMTLSQQTPRARRAKGFTFRKISFFSTIPMAVVLATVILNPTTSLAQVLPIRPMAVPPIPGPPPIPTAPPTCSDQALNGDYSITLIGVHTTDVVKQLGIPFPQLTALLSQNLSDPYNLAPAGRTNDGVILGSITGMPGLQLSPRMSIVRASFDGNGNLTSKEANVPDSTISNGAPMFSAGTHGSYTVSPDCTVSILIGPNGKYGVTGVVVNGGTKIHGIASMPFLPAYESVQLVVEAVQI